MAQITLSNLGLILPVAACRVLYVRKLSCNHNNNINANSSDLSRVAVAVVAVAVVQEVEVGFCVFTRTPPSRLIRSFSGTAGRHLRRLGGAFDAGWRGHEYLQPEPQDAELQDTGWRSHRKRLPSLQETR